MSWQYGDLLMGGGAGLAVGACQELGDGADGAGILQQRCMALARHGDGFEPWVAGAHLLERPRAQDVGVLAADRQHRYARQRGELGPQLRHRSVDEGNGPGDVGVVPLRRQAVVVVEPGAGVVCPLLGGHGGELALVHLAHELGGFLPVGRQGNAADVGYDARKPLALDHRADVVEHQGAHGAGAQRGHQHGDQAAARGADDGCVVQALHGHEVQHVVELHQHGVVPPVAVVLGAAAAATVDGVYVAPCLIRTCERGRQVVEVAGVAREPGKAQHRPAHRAGSGIVACIEPQAIAGGEMNVGPGLHPWGSWLSDKANPHTAIPGLARSSHTTGRALGAY